MSERTKLKKTKMPRWLWQLRRKGFHVQLKKYLHFLWRQRPAGCNWSRAIRAKYFNRTIRTITRWDKLLIDYHLVWYSGKGTMKHRIGARPYYQKAVWLVKSGQKKLTVRGDTNVPPYTAQHKNTPTSYSSAANEPPALRQQSRLKVLPAAGEKATQPPCPPSKGDAVQDTETWKKTALEWLQLLSENARKNKKKPHHSKK